MHTVGQRARVGGDGVCRLVDRSGESQIDQAFTRAALGLGIARPRNGVISVTQVTEFAGQSAGIGVNFTPGESGLSR